MPLNFNPPLLNSANPWATTKEDIQALYDCPSTGALTIRTSVFGGFQHDDQIHQYRIFGNGEPSHFISYQVSADVPWIFVSPSCRKSILIMMAL